MVRQFAQKKPLFDESGEKNDDATSDRDHESENKTVECKHTPRKVISAVANSKGENSICPPSSFRKGTQVKTLQTMKVREMVESFDLLCCKPSASFIVINTLIYVMICYLYDLWV